MKKILMVCLGNICRSPLAEGVMKHKALKANFTVEVDSAGTAAYHVGELPDARSIDIARKYGIDISDQRARKFVVADFDRFDHILVMDTSNLNDVLAQARNEQDENKVEMILNYKQPGSNQVVPDPYYGGKDGFEQVYRMLDEACAAFIRLHSNHH